MIYDCLFEWQKQIVDKYKDKSAYGLFLDCGLGKTPLGLAFTEANRCTKVMVITINSKAIEDNNIKGSWWEWAEKSEISYIIQNKKSLSLAHSADMLILNYESLFKRGKDLKSKVVLKDEIEAFIKNCKGHNFAMIIDESHKVKDLQSLQTQAVIKIQKLAKLYSTNCYTYLLSGTPFTTGFVDLYSQLKLLGCQINKTDFVDTFCVRGHVHGLLDYQQPIIGYKNVDMLYNLVHQYAITIKSKDVINLPEQVFVNHINDMSKEFTLLTQEKLPGMVIQDVLRSRNVDFDETLYSTTSRRPNPFYRNIDYPEFKYLADTPGGLWLRARQLSIGFQGNAEESIWFTRTRLDSLNRFLEQNEDNYIIFYNYTPELIEIYNICEKLGYNIDVYCGEVKSMVYYSKYVTMDASEKLQSTKNVIIANFASGSTGMNWQEYSKCILFSLPLYKDWEQGLKRIHRIGQKETTVYHIFYENNWLDLGMKKALDEKIQYTEDMFKEGLECMNK